MVEKKVMPKLFINATVTNYTNITDPIRKIQIERKKKKKKKSVLYGPFNEHDFNNIPIIKLYYSQWISVSALYSFKFYLIKSKQLCLPGPLLSQPQIMVPMLRPIPLYW